MSNSRHGGARSGAGRKRSAINRLSARAIAMAAKTGMLPHEILLNIARGRNVLDDGKLSRQEKLDAAKACAPYYAPKLIAVAVKAGASDNPYEELLRHADGKSRGLPGVLAATIGTGITSPVRQLRLASTQPVLDKERKG